MKERVGRTPIHAVDREAMRVVREARAREREMPAWLVILFGVALAGLACVLTLWLAGCGPRAEAVPADSFARVANTGG